VATGIDRRLSHLGVLDYGNTVAVQHGLEQAAPKLGCRVTLGVAATSASLVVPSRPRTCGVWSRPSRERVAPLVGPRRQPLPQPEGMTIGTALALFDRARAAGDLLDRIRPLAALLTMSPPAPPARPEALCRPTW
jgi:hypothetical protein